MAEAPCTGGAIASLLDIAMGLAVRSASSGGGVTVSLAISYLAPAKGAVLAEAEVLKGRS